VIAPDRRTRSKELPRCRPPRPVESIPLPTAGATGSHVSGLKRFPTRRDSTLPMRVYDQLVSTPAALSATICAPWDDCFLDPDVPGEDDSLGDEGVALIRPLAASTHDPLGPGYPKRRLRYR
jgi:hypothetical protein